MQHYREAVNAASRYDPAPPACRYGCAFFLSIWSLSNAFTSAFKKFNPVPQFKATAKLGEFLAQLSC